MLYHSCSTIYNITSSFKIHGFKTDVFVLVHTFLDLCTGHRCRTNDSGKAAEDREAEAFPRTPKGEVKTFTKHNFFCLFILKIGVD